MTPSNLSQIGFAEYFHLLHEKQRIGWIFFIYYMKNRFFLLLKRINGNNRRGRFLAAPTLASNVEGQILGVKCDASKDEISIIVHHVHRNMQKRSCKLSTRFCQYIGLLGLYAWILQGCQMSRSKKSWRQMLGCQMIYSQRRDNHHRAPRTPQHAEKVLQTQHPLSVNILGTEP